MLQICFILICLYSLSLGYDMYEGTVGDFVGINSNVGAYDKGIIEQLAKVAFWMREYHRWEFYEENPDIYGWDDKTPAFKGGAWPFHTRFVQECAKHGIQMVICTERSTPWAASSGDWRDPPYGTHDGTEEAHYRDKVEFISQQVARYGSKKVETSKLETADQLSGLNLVRYYEDENEPDQWWWQPTWPADLYANYVNAVHDGYQIPADPQYPLLGIKTVDQDAVHVLGGMTGGDLSYLNAILANTDGRIPFDVLNFHHYCSQSGTSQKGICPEHKRYGFQKTVDAWLAWRDDNVPGMPLWCTEFGWDTYKDSNGRSSYIYAGEQAQANYLLRSLFLLMIYGLDKGFIFFDVDPNSIDVTQFSSAGIMTDSGHGLEPKTAFYYLATLQNLVGDFSFHAVDTFAEGDPEIYSVVLKSPLKNNRYCYVLWCRKAGGKYDDGTVIEDYELINPGIINATAIEPVDGQEFGREVPITLNQAGELNSSVTIPILSETPLFLFVEMSQSLSVNGQRKEGKTLKSVSYPNPFNCVVRFTFEVKVAGQVDMQLYDIRGRLIKQWSKSCTPGFHRWNLDFQEEHLPGGVYIITLFVDNQYQTQKICYMK